MEKQVRVCVCVCVCVCVRALTCIRAYVCKRVCVCEEMEMAGPVLWIGLVRWRLRNECVISVYSPVGCCVRTHCLCMMRIAGSIYRAHRSGTLPWLLVWMDLSSGVAGSWCVCVCVCVWCVCMWCNPMQREM